MKIVKEFRREDKSKVKVEMRLSLPDLYLSDNEVGYIIVGVWHKKYKKKKWTDVIGQYTDTYEYRGLSSSERKSACINKINEYITIKEQDDLALELWESIKPVRKIM